jgi:hypothetical protein
MTSAALLALPIYYIIKNKKQEIYKDKTLA